MTTTTNSTLWERVGAALYDPFLAKGERQGMAARRASLLAEARGRVLEIGAGTGLNLEHYPTGIESLVLTEPVAPMADRLRRRAADHSGVEVVEASAERLPFPTASFDTVVSTMVLCTVEDVDAALDELARVLEPGGTLLFIEHVHVDGTRLGRRQDRWARLWSAFAQGCRCDRDLENVIGRRFDHCRVDSDDWRGMPSLVRPLIVGSATPKPGRSHAPRIDEWRARTSA